MDKHVSSFLCCATHLLVSIPVILPREGLVTVTALVPKPLVLVDVFVSLQVCKVGEDEITHLAPEAMASVNPLVLLHPRQRLEHSAAVATADK